MDRRTAELVLRQCLGHQPGEQVLVVTDNDLHDLGNVFYQAALGIGAEAVLEVMPVRTMHGAEPPASVAQAMLTPDIALLVTRFSLSHTDARRAATEVRGTRMASMPGVDGARLGALLDIDYTAMAERAQLIAAHLVPGAEVRVTSPAGTDLTFRLPARPPMFDLGQFTTRGAFGNLPAGEVFLAPEEGSARGVLVVDGSMAGLGRLDKPITFEVREGFAVEIDSAALREILDRYGREARNVAEFGIGLNPAAQVVGNIIEDEKVSGTIHIAFGNNKSMGGTIGVKCHLDGLVLHPTVTVNGKVIPADLLAGPARAASQETGGKVAVSAPTPAQILAGLSRTVLYESLFENSNDAQYVLDMDQALFLMVNHAFELLTGYTREEMLSGKVRAPDIIATESQPLYSAKREQRREIQSDRYDIRIQRKGGTKVPVEVSVRRIRLNGRELVVGALRDLTDRDRMQRTIKDQVFEQARNSSRLYTLTEKIQNVPKLAAKLLHVQDESEFFEQTASFLCIREGLQLSGVTFYLVRDQHLEPVHSTVDKKLRRLDLRKDHPFVQVLRGEVPRLEIDNQLVFPLVGHDQPIGLMQIFLDPKEKELIDGNVRLRDSYQELLRTLATQLGLMIDNMRLHETVRQQSITDQLTGTYNRRHFDVRLNDEIRRAHRYSRPLSLILIDLDSFKKINDTYGHRQGDVVLTESARIFQQSSRDVDIICRYGGDEFVCLLPETEIESAALKAEQLRRAVLHHKYTSLAPECAAMSISLSLGVAAASEECQTADQLLRHADEAMYHAKRSGKNRIGLWRKSEPSLFVPPEGA